MLRYDHLPSDFHPLFLFLGERDELAALAAVLRSFAENPRTLTLADHLPGARSRAKVKLVAEDGEHGDFGLRADDQGNFRWGLNAWQAERIAERIDALTQPDHKSGSDIIELGVDGEIPIKVSRGEFTDDFLIRRF